MIQFSSLFMPTMDFLYILFPVSGVETWVFVPPLVALIISFFTSMGGISGAFLLLPFQMSFLNYTSPSVSATNHLFNIVAIPAGVYRYIKEGRMVWPLTWVVIIGTSPGVLIGYYIRVYYLPDPKAFKLFVGCVLLYIGIRLLYEIAEKAWAGKVKMDPLDQGLKKNLMPTLVGTTRDENRITPPPPSPLWGEGRGEGLFSEERRRELKEEQNARVAVGIGPEGVVKMISFSLTKIEYEFCGQRFSFSTIWMFILAFLVGIIGGAYGIGGGSIIAPFCITVFHLPVYTIAGAALMGTFFTSILGVLFYSFIPIKSGLVTAPDWFLGLLFGIGGFIGMYLGALVQKFVPQKFIKIMLGVIILFLALQYISQYLI